MKTFLNENRNKKVKNTNLKNYIYILFVGTTALALIIISSFDHKPKQQSSNFWNLNKTNWVHTNVDFIQFFVSLFEFAMFPIENIRFHKQAYRWNRNNKFMREKKNNRQIQQTATTACVQNQRHDVVFIACMKRSKSLCTYKTRESK